MWRADIPATNGTGRIFLFVAITACSSPLETQIMIKRNMKAVASSPLSNGPQRRFCHTTGHIVVTREGEICAHRERRETNSKTCDSI